MYWSSSLVIYTRAWFPTLIIAQNVDLLFQAATNFSWAGVPHPDRTPGQWFSGQHASFWSINLQFRTRPPAVTEIRRLIFCPTERMNRHNYGQCSRVNEIKIWRKENRVFFSQKCFNYAALIVDKNKCKSWSLRIDAIEVRKSGISLSKVAARTVYH